MLLKKLARYRLYANAYVTADIVTITTDFPQRVVHVLVPPLYIVIVDANTLHQYFASLITAQQWKDNLPTNAVLLSGPSKTADIQQTLAYGAHGPKELIVLLTSG